MSVVEGGAGPGLVARARGILMHPRAEWGVIDAEAATPRGLYLGYACILAAIPVIAGLIGGQLFGYGAFGVSFHPPLVGAIVSAVIGYLLSLLTVFILSLIIDALAPSFDGQKNQIQALKVAVYASTAAWVGGIFGLFPPLWIVAALCGLYGLYLLYVGLPIVMKAPPAKAMGYTAVTVIAAIVLFIVAGVVVRAIESAAMWGAAGPYAAAHDGRLAGTVRMGGTSVDLARLQAAAAAAALENRQNGKVATIDPERLKALLPASLAGLPRTEISAQSVGTPGASNAQAVYAQGGARITLTVTDLSAMGAFAGMAGAMGVEASKETADGYEKVGKVAGRMTTEEWSRGSASGKYGVLVANRFMVQAEGSGTTMDALKGAVAAVGPDRLEGMARG